MDCSAQHFKETKFVDWSVENLKNCATDKLDVIGNSVWPGNGSVGLLILLGIIILGVILMKYRGKK